MAEALSKAVGDEVHLAGDDSAPVMTIEEMELVIKHWRSIDENFSDSDQDEVSELLTTFHRSYDWWMDYLVKVPSDVIDRYKRIIRLLVENKMIPADEEEIELSIIGKVSPTELTRRGKKLSDWYRQHKELYSFR